MPLPRPGQLLSVICTCILLLYCAKLATGRGTLFWAEWTNTALDYKRALLQRDHCRNHDTAHVWEDGCAKATEYVQVWPIMRAFVQTLDQTYLCVDVPCSSLLESVVTTWTGVAVCALLAIIAVCVARFHWMQPRQDVRAHNSMAWDPVYVVDDGGPNSSVRRRLLHGGQVQPVV